MTKWLLFRDLNLRRNRSLKKTEMLISAPISLPLETQFFKAEIRVKNAPKTWRLGARLNWIVSIDGAGWARINGLESEDIHINKPEIFVVPSLLRVPVFRVGIPHWIESARFYLSLQSTFTSEEYSTMPFSQMPSPNTLQAKTTNERTLYPVKGPDGLVPSGELYPANARRGGLFIQNLSTQPLYLLFSNDETAQAGPDSKSLIVPANQVYETTISSTERCTFAFGGEGVGEVNCIELLA